MRTKCPTTCPSYKLKITACKKHLGHNYKHLSNYTDGAEEKAQGYGNMSIFAFVSGIQKVFPHAAPLDAATFG